MRIFGFFKNFPKLLNIRNKKCIFLLTVTLYSCDLFSTLFIWNNPGPANADNALSYFNANNWIPADRLTGPINPGDEAFLGSIIVGPVTIDLPGTQIPNGLPLTSLIGWTFDSPFPYTIISGTQSLTTAVTLGFVRVATGTQGDHMIGATASLNPLPPGEGGTLFLQNNGDGNLIINGTLLPRRSNLSGTVFIQTPTSGPGPVVYGLTSETVSLSTFIETGATLNAQGQSSIGNVIIEGFLNLQNTNVVQPTKNVVISGSFGGVWDIGSFSPVPTSVSIASLTYINGTIIGDPTDTIFLNDLSIRGGFAINPTLSFIQIGGVPIGQILFDGTSAGTAILNNVNLGEVGRTFNVEGGVAFTEMVVQGVLSGSSFQKSGPGRLLFEGGSPNTFTGDAIVQEGNLRLAKPNGLAISGNLTVIGGTVEHMLTQQYSSTSIVTLLGGTSNLTASNQSIKTLIFNGGTYIPGILNLVGTGNALTMRGGNTLSGTVNLTSTTGGTVIFDSTIGMTADISAALSLGSIARIFNIADGSAAVDMLLSGFASGTGGITKTGLGTLSFSGATANTYTGLTTISEGTMLLAKGGGVTSIPGDVLINGGTLTNGATEQIADTSSLTLSSGSWVLSGNDEAIESFTFNGGSYLAGGATLSLTSTGTALTMRDVTLTGQVDLIGASGGDVVFNATNGGTATIDSIDLGIINRTFNIANGSTDTDMVVNSSSSTGGGLIKQGAGLLELAGTHTYPGATSTIAEGAVRVLGNWTTAINVSAGGTLKGTGAVIGDVSLDGTIQPGNSIGTIFLVGTQTFNSGSVTQIEFNPTANDLIDIMGTLTINPGATIALFPEAANYPSDFSMTIITASGGLTGEFSTVTSLFPSFVFSVSYTPTDVLVQVIASPFSDIFDAGNLGAISICIDQEAESSSDFEFVVSILRDIPSVSDLASAIDQLQPSQLTGLALSQENNSVRIRSMMMERLFELYRCCRLCSNDCSWNAWGSAKADWYVQDPVKEFFGFRTYSGTAMVGVDFQGACNFIYGGGLGYSYSDIRWKESRGDGQIHSGYASLYSGWYPGCFFANAIALGSYSRYCEVRNINFSGIDVITGAANSIIRKAKGEFNGGEILGHLDLGLVHSWGCLDVVPFAAIEYTYLWQQKYTERGAGSLNLEIMAANYDLLRFEMGVNFAYCYTTCFGRKVSFDTRFSYVREDRFTGDRFRVSFEDTECVAKIRGLNPTRNLFVPLGEITVMSCDECKTFSLTYEAEIGSRYFDQNIGIKFICRF